MFGSNTNQINYDKMLLLNKELKEKEKKKGKLSYFQNKRTKSSREL